MLSLTQVEGQQIPLIHTVHEDDRILLNDPEAEWFRILSDFPWQEYRERSAEYYNALYQFNLNEAEKRKNRGDHKKNTETKKEAIQRLLFSRPTAQAEKDHEVPILYQAPSLQPISSVVDPEKIAPGIVPARLYGRKPKCFFAMFKSFLGATLMGFSPEPEIVYNLLRSNPSFNRVCGFAPKSETDEYCFRHAPSLRKLEQFDQIMTEAGLWENIKLDEVRRNISEGIIKKEKELVGDTTHYHAYSGFEVVHYKDEKNADKKKSQSKVTKRCRCQDMDNCSHSWELADDGAGTIVKANKKMFWGHKASIVGFPQQGIPLDAVAIADAATFDGETFFPHVKRLFSCIPEVEPLIETVLYDSACDSRKLKDLFIDEFGIQLKTSINPRRKKAVSEGLPRGMESLSPYGVPFCADGHEMEYKGIRFETERFIYQAPRNDDDSPVCNTCVHKKDCCPNAQHGRTITIPFDLLPHIDSSDPPMAKRFKAIMTRRPSVERMIKRLKCDLGDDRLSKRGNASFQAYLDKTMISFHVLLRN